MPGLDWNLMNEAAAASQCSRLDKDEVHLKVGALSSVEVSDLLPEVTRSPRAASVLAPDHLSYAHINLSPKPAVGHSLPPIGHPKHSSLLFSPDEGLGLSSPPEWFEHREPIKEWAQSSSSFQPMSDPEGQGSAPFTTLRSPESPGETTHRHTHTQSLTLRVQPDV